MYLYNELDHICGSFSDYYGYLVINMNTMQRPAAAWIDRKVSEDHGL